MRYLGLLFLYLAFVSVGMATEPSVPAITSCAEALTPSHLGLYVETLRLAIDRKLVSLEAIDRLSVRSPIPTKWEGDLARQTAFRSSLASFLEASQNSHSDQSDQLLAAITEVKLYARGTLQESIEASQDAKSIIAPKVTESFNIYKWLRPGETLHEIRTFVTRNGSVFWIASVRSKSADFGLIFGMGDGLPQRKKMSTLDMTQSNIFESIKGHIYFVTFDKRFEGYHVLRWAREKAKVVGAIKVDGNNGANRVRLFEFSNSVHAFLKSVNHRRAEHYVELYRQDAHEFKRVKRKVVSGNLSLHFDFPRSESGAPLAVVSEDNKVNGLYDLASLTMTKPKHFNHRFAYAESFSKNSVLGAAVNRARTTLTLKNLISGREEKVAIAGHDLRWHKLNVAHRNADELFLFLDNGKVLQASKGKLVQIEGEQQTFWRGNYATFKHSGSTYILTTGYNINLEVLDLTNSQYLVVPMPKGYSIQREDLQNPNSRSTPFVVATDRSGNIALVEIFSP